MKIGGCVTDCGVDLGDSKKKSGLRKYVIWHFGGF